MCRVGAISISESRISDETCIESIADISDIPSGHMRSKDMRLSR